MVFFSAILFFKDKRNYYLKHYKVANARLNILKSRRGKAAFMQALYSDYRLFIWTYLLKKIKILRELLISTH